jgi:hypothetical protein
MSFGSADVPVFSYLLFALGVALCTMSVLLAPQTRGMSPSCNIRNMHWPVRHTVFVMLLRMRFMSEWQWCAPQSLAGSAAGTQPTSHALALVANKS